MRKIIQVVCLLLCVAPGIGRAEYLQDIEYKEIAPQPVTTGAKIEVREFFWYGCPHCFHMEPLLESWLRKLPRDAQFVRTPAVLSPNWEPGARAYFTFQALGITSRVHSAFFRAIHVEHRNMDDVDNVAAFAAAYGISKQRFVNTYNSFSVDADVRSTAAMELGDNFDSVPTFVVDGRYVTSPTMAGGQKRCLRIVDYLIKKAAVKRAQDRRGR